MFEFLPNEQQKTQIRTHLASYLKWVFIHNPEFQKTLTTEDLSNVWIQEMKHPPWVDERIRQGDLLFFAHINEYIHQYKDQAYLFDITVTPEFKLELKNNQTKPTIRTNPNQEDAITPKQLKYLMYLTKKHNRRNIHLQSLTKKEASQLISELVKLG